MLFKRNLRYLVCVFISLLMLYAFFCIPTMAEDMSINENETVMTEEASEPVSDTVEESSFDTETLENNVASDTKANSDVENETPATSLIEEETTTAEKDSNEQGEEDTPDPIPEETYSWKTKISSTYTGLAQEVSGTWYYLVNGKPDFTYSNLVNYNGSWFYVHNGIIDWSYTTLSQVNGSGVWYYVKNGKLDWNFTGLYQFYSTWYYIQKGRLNWGYNNLVYWAGNWFYVKGGRIDWNYSNLVQYSGKWFYVHNGKIDWSYSTLAQVNGSGTWYYVKNGQIDWNYTGLSQYYTTWYYINKGRLDWGYTGLAYYGGGWFYVKGGRLDWSYTGLAYYNGDWFYMENGKLNWGYSGKATIPGYNKQFDVVNGKVSGGLIAPSAALANRADSILNSVGWNLRAAFNWSKMNWTVYDVNPGYGVSHYATYGFNNHHGNCYVMAGTFVTLARELGYEAYQITGSVPSLNGGMTPHSWAEVKIDNKFYVFDPDFEKEAGGNGYQFSYGTRGTWRYSDYYRMHN